jgi:acyl-CoA thioester hydrolase
MPDIAGRIEDGVHRLSIRVYYEDTDLSGAVYHANYLKFCERGRSDCLRLIGIHHHELVGRLGFVVRRMTCDFRKPARIDDVLEVETRFRSWAGARMELDQQIVRDSDILFSAEVTVALVDAVGKLKRLPEELVKAFEEAYKS